MATPFVSFGLVNHVGKFTVAKAIAEINGAAVVDNQLINLPIFCS